MSYLNKVAAVALRQASHWAAWPHQCWLHPLFLLTDPQGRLMLAVSLKGLKKPQL